jgi:hypothetical protein
MTSKSDDRSLGELFAELSRETGVLVRKEMELATTEMTWKAKLAATHLATVGTGAALAHAGFLVLLGAVVIGLASIGIEPWLSAFIVAIVTIGLGCVVANKGLASLRRTTVVPTETIQSIKEATTWTNKTPA